MLETTSDHRYVVYHIIYLIHLFIEENTLEGVSHSTELRPSLMLTVFEIVSLVAMNLQQRFEGLFIVLLIGTYTKNTFLCSYIDHFDQNKTVSILNWVDQSRFEPQFHQITSLLLFMTFGRMRTVRLSGDQGILH